MSADCAIRMGYAYYDPARLDNGVSVAVSVDILDSWTRTAHCCLGMGQRTTGRSRIHCVLLAALWISRVVRS
jgi:hypothetical protein